MELNFFAPNSEPEPGTPNSEPLTTRVDKLPALTILPDSHDPWIYFHETNLPTFQAHPKAPARISSPDENRWWPGDIGAPPPTGAKATASGGS
jgi:3',5'-cyclic AMP phosphodiesterase CpdA